MDGIRVMVEGEARIVRSGGGVEVAELEGIDGERHVLLVRATCVRVLLRMISV